MFYYNMTLRPELSYPTYKCARFQPYTFHGFPDNENKKMKNCENELVSDLNLLAQMHIDNGYLVVGILINPWCACSAKVTVLGLCVWVCVQAAHL